MSIISIDSESLDLFDYEDFQKEAQCVLLCLAELDRSVSFDVLAAILQGRKTNYIRQAKLYQLAAYGDLTFLTIKECFTLFHSLLNQGYLRSKRVHKKRFAVSLSKKGLKQLQAPRSFSVTSFEVTEKELIAYEQYIDQYDYLIQVRQSIFQQVKKIDPTIKIYHIAKNNDLKELIKFPPETIEDLSNKCNWSANEQELYGSLLFNALLYLKSDIND